VCANWDVVTTDESTGDSTTLSTTAYGEKVPWVFGGVMEVYGVVHCAELPANGSVTFTYVDVEPISGGTPPGVPWNVWTGLNWSNWAATSQPACGLGVSGDSSDVSLSFYPTTVSPPQAPAQCGVLNAGEGLIAGQSVASCNGLVRLSLQLDGNLVLTDQGTVRWSSQSAGTAGFAALEQDDGDFALYDVTGQLLWDSSTGGNASAYGAVQNDGNFVIYTTDGYPLWASNTGGMAP
jgi:hypothetical protein